MLHKSNRPLLATLSCLPAGGKEVKRLEWSLWPVWPKYDQQAAAAELAVLRQLTQLQHLSISGLPQAALFRALPDLPAIPLRGMRHLDIYACTETGLAVLLPAVQAVTFLRCCFTSHHGPNADAAWPQRLQLLTQLALLHIDQAHLAAIPAGLPATLTSLAIRHQRVVVAQLHQLARLQRLRALSLSHTRSSACRWARGIAVQAALEELPPLPRLAVLDLTATGLEEVPATVAAQAALTMLVLDLNRWAAAWLLRLS